MKIKIITFLILSGMAGVCLAQGIGAAPPENQPSSSSTGSTTATDNIDGINNTNSENAQDNSATGAQGNVENSTY